MTTALKTPPKTPKTIKPKVKKFTDLPDGRCRFQICKVNSRTSATYRKSGTRASRKLAEKYVAEVEQQLEDGTFQDNRPLEKDKLADYIQTYLKEITVNKSEGAKQEANRLKAWLRHEFAERAIGRIDGQDITAYIQQRRKDPNGRGSTIAEQTIHLEVTALSNVFELAKSQHSGLVNPTKEVFTAHKPGKSRSRDIRIPLNLQPSLLKKLDEQNTNKNYVLIPELAIETGLRLGEFWRLKKNDIHFKDEFLIATDNQNIKGKVIVHKRDVPMTPRAIELLSFVKKIKDPDAFIFDGTNYGECSKNFTKACQSVKGLEKATFHSTRHEFCSRNAPKYPIQILMKITGHKTIAMLQRYYNPTGKELVQAMKKANAIEPESTPQLADLLKTLGSSKLTTAQLKKLIKAVKTETA